MILYAIYRSQERGSFSDELKTYFVSDVLFSEFGDSIHKDLRGGLAW